MTQKWSWQTKSPKTCKMSLRKKSSETLKEPIASQLPTQTTHPHQHHPFLFPKCHIGTYRKKSLSRRCTRSLRQKEEMPL